MWRIELADLHAFVARAFGACGVPDAAAAVAARALCYADEVGMDTHGVVNLGRIYLPRLRAGVIDARAVPEVVQERGAAAAVDAHDALGLVAGTFAMELAVERAREHGVGAVSVRRSSHMGSAGYYSSLAARAGMVGFATTNLGAQRIVRPPGGLEPRLGTHPISLAAPAGELPDFVLDMSTTVVATGQVRAAAARGEAIPEGWLVDDAGRPVTDPAAYDRGEAHLQWLGGTPETGAYKGYGLAVVVEVLAGALSGAATGPASAAGADDRDVGHFFLALDPTAFGAPGAFATAMDGVLGGLAATPAQPGRSVGYAGRREAEVAARRRATGVPVSPALRDALTAVAEEAGIAPPAFAAAREAVAP